MKNTVMKVGQQHLFDIDVIGDPIPVNKLLLNDVVSVSSEYIALHLSPIEILLDRYSY